MLGARVMGSSSLGTTHPSSPLHNMQRATSMRDSALSSYGSSTDGCSTSAAQQHTEHNDASSLRAASRHASGWLAPMTSWSNSSKLSPSGVPPLETRAHVPKHAAAHAAHQPVLGTRGTGLAVRKQRMRDKIRIRGKKLVSNAVERVRDSSVAVTRVLRPHAENVEWAVGKCLTGHTDGIWDIAVCAWENETNETIIGSASADRTARIWCVESAREIATLVGHKGSVNSVSFHPYQRLLCTGSGDKSCNVWRLPAFGACDQDEAEKDQDGASYAADAPAPSGCAHKGAARRKTLRPVLSLWGHSNAVYVSPPFSFSFFKMCVFFVFCFVLLFLEVVLLTTQHLPPMCGRSSAAWMPWCGLIATASWDRSALLFDVASGASKALRTLAGHHAPLTMIAAARFHAPPQLSPSRVCVGRVV